MKVSPLFNLTKLSSRRYADTHIKEVFEELCCDEYYVYFNEIDYEFMLFASKAQCCTMQELVNGLLWNCASNGSIDAFEYILSKYGRNDCLEHFIISIDSNGYYNYKFIKYLYEKYPNMTHCAKIHILKRFFFNKHIDLIKSIFNNCGVLTWSLGCGHNWVQAKKYLNWVLDYLCTVLHYTQYDVSKYLFDEHKNLLCDVLDYKCHVDVDSDDVNDVDIDDKPCPKIKTSSNKYHMQPTRKTLTKYIISLQHVVMYKLRHAIRKLCSSVNKPVYNVYAICPILDLMLDTFGHTRLKSIVGTMDFELCTNTQVIDWFGKHDLINPAYFYKKNVSELANIKIISPTINFFHRVVHGKKKFRNEPVYVNGVFQHLNREIVFQWLNYYFANVHDADLSVEYIVDLIGSSNKYVGEYVILTGLHEKVDSDKLKQMLDDDLCRSNWAYENYFHFQMIIKRKKFIEYYTERYEHGKLKFL